MISPTDHRGASVAFSPAGDASFGTRSARQHHLAFFFGILNLLQADRRPANTTNPGLPIIIFCDNGGHPLPRDHANINQKTVRSPPLPCLSLSLIIPVGEAGEKPLSGRKRDEAATLDTTTFRPPSASEEAAYLPPLEQYIRLIERSDRSVGFKKLA